MTTQRRKSTSKPRTSRGTAQTRTQRMNGPEAAQTTEATPVSPENPVEPALGEHVDNPDLIKQAAKNEPAVLEASEVNVAAAGDDTTDHLPPEASRDEDEPEEKHIEKAPNAWRTDGNGNPLVSIEPPRPFYSGTEFLPFEYGEVGDPDADYVVAEEDVFRTFYYQNSKRRGQTLAYRKGEHVPKDALGRINDDPVEVKPEDTTVNPPEGEWGLGADPVEVEAKKGMSTSDPYEDAKPEDEPDADE